MADRGHELTDEKLKRLENKIANEYAKAVKDMEKKLADYLSKTEEQRKILETKVKAGEMTQKDFSDWCYSHTMTGKRWQKMLEVLASDMHHANEIAMKIAKGGMADIYALNVNYAIYQMEHDAEIDLGFTLYNHDTAEYLLGDQRQLMPKPSEKKAAQIAANPDMQWNKEKIQSAVLQGVLQGESPYKVAERLRGVGQMNYNASVRYARTMGTSAQNAGRYESYRRAKSLGVDLVIEWLATLDGRTRHHHRLMHGKRTTVDKPFKTPDGYTIYYPADCTGESDAPQREIWNCFVGETNVASDSEIVRSYKHEYSGELVTVKTASGVNFTCTPNHPILTTFGWIPAARLHKGDDLLVASISDNAVFTDRNVNQTHPTFETIHKTLSKLGTVDKRSMSDFNFHGDIPTSDIEVVSKKRLLRGCFDTGISEGINELLFKNADTLVTCKRHFMAGFRRVYISTLRFMSRRRKALTLFWWRLRHSDVHGLGTVTGGNTGIPQNTINNLSAMSNIGGECLDGLAGKVFADNIVSVNRHTGRHTLHVYNLQTENGYYFVNNIIDQTGQKSSGNFAIAHNCRCTLVAWVKGFEGDTVKTSPKMGGLSFEEWLKATPQRESYIDPKKPKVASRPTKAKRV